MRGAGTAALCCCAACLQEDHQLLQEGGEPVGALPQQHRHFGGHLHRQPGEVTTGSAAIGASEQGVAGQQHEPGQVSRTARGPQAGPSPHLRASQSSRHKLAGLLHVEGLQDQVQRRGLQRGLQEGWRMEQLGWLTDPKPCGKCGSQHAHAHAHTQELANCPGTPERVQVHG